MACDFNALSNIDTGDPERSLEMMRQCTDTLMSPEMWFWAIGLTVVGAVVGAWIGKSRNAVRRDLILGAALGPIGWIISLCLPVAKPKPACPSCRRPVDAGDRHCRHCGMKLSASPASPSVR